MHILYLGDIVGSPGRRAFVQALARLRGEHEIDLVVVNAENAAGGRGATPEIAASLLDAGAHVLTMGDHTWDQKEIAPFLDSESRIIRPANFPEGCPGRGWTTVEVEGVRITVFQVIGRTFMPAHYDCPFRTADRLLQKFGKEGVVLAEIHAEATSEKIAMGRHLDGRVASVVGTHTHVQTSDERVLPGGTAYITDLGMTGPRDSVLGREIEPVIKRFVTGIPQKFEVAKGATVVEGVLLEIDEATRHARSIRRVREIFDS